ELEPNSDGAAYGSTTSLGASIVSQTSRSRLAINPGVTGRLFGGGTDASDSNQISPRLSAQFDHRVAAVDFRSGLSFDVRPTAFSEIGEDGSGVPDLDVIDQNATQISLIGNAGFTYRINDRNRATIGTDVRVIRFDDDATGLTPNTTIGVSGEFAHDVNERVTSSFGAGLRRVRLGGATDTETLIFDVDGGLNAFVSPRFSLGGSLGVSLIDRTDGAGGGDTGLGLNASANFAYQVFDDLSLSFNARQGVEPSADGELQNQTTLSLGATQFINQRERVSLNLGLSRQAAADTSVGASDDTTQFQTGASYQWTITPEVVAQLGYTMRWELQPDDAMSHKVFLSLSRSLFYP
ncbi:MAG: hypothetical protein WD969_04335, partial [Paracoccaceae bacterium]